MQLKFHIDHIIREWSIFKKLQLNRIIYMIFIEFDININRIT